MPAARKKATNGELTAKSIDQSYLARCARSRRSYLALCHDGVGAGSTARAKLSNGGGDWKNRGEEKAKNGDGGWLIT